MSITKQELIDIIATKAQTTNKTAEAMLNAYTEAIMEALSQGLNVQLIGFGKFEVQLRKARKGRNPQTGEAIDIPAKTVPVFRPGATMKRAAAKAP
jgi:DNA-binding protein HU-beta